MSTTSAGSRLSGIAFTDPHHDPSWDHVRVPAAGGAADLPSSPRVVRPEVVGAGRRWTFEEWVEATWSTSLLVLDGGTVVHEWYAAGLGRDTLFLGASASKSVLAHLVGRAVREGSLDLADPVTAHVPELVGSGYDGPSVLDVLTMTSGVDWVEDHRDPDGVASRLVGCFAGLGDSRALLRAVRPAVDPGTRFAYCTADSQVLDWVRERTTGLTFGAAATRLWRDLGCPSDAVVTVDAENVALAGGGLAATARDWARVALLAVDGGAILDREWVEAAARPTYPFLAPGRLPSSITSHAGFGYHWWPMDDDGRRVTADGSRGQLACADRQTGTVVVKTSLWPYTDPLVDRQARDLSYLGLHTLLDALPPPTKESAP